MKRREPMEWERVVLAGSWVSLMLIYLLGDVLRIYAGDATPGQIDGEFVGEWAWTLAATIMLVPIAMILLTLLTPPRALRWITILVCAALVVLNVAGMPYPGAFDNMLLIVSFALNGFMVWAAWSWLRR